MIDEREITQALADRLWDRRLARFEDSLPKPADVWGGTWKRDECGMWSMGGWMTHPEWCDTPGTQFAIHYPSMTKRVVGSTQAEQMRLVEAARCHKLKAA